jgi:hypothetical protein
MQVIYTIKNEDENLVRKVAQSIAMTIRQNIQNSEEIQKAMSEKNLEISFIIK